MTRLLVALLLVLSCFMLAAPDAAAISAGCLPGGFPTTPGPDAVGKVFQRFTGSPAEIFRADIWRVVCSDDPNQIALLLRITPQNANPPFVCFAEYDLIQGGQQLTTRVLQTPTSTSSFCDDLLVPTTFSLERLSGAPFDPKAAFTFVYDGSTAGIQSLEVPAGSGIPVLGITVVSTGCGPCSAGQTATFHIHTVNPGPPLGVDLRAGLQLPNGPSFPLVGLCTVTVVESGEHNIPLLSIIVPGDVPNGTYAIEAAILDPIFGDTLSRHSLSAVKQ